MIDARLRKRSWGKVSRQHGDEYGDGDGKVQKSWSDRPSGLEELRSRTKAESCFISCLERSSIDSRSDIHHSSSSAFDMALSRGIKSILSSVASVSHQHQNVFWGDLTVAKFDIASAFDPVIPVTTFKVIASHGSDRLTSSSLAHPCTKDRFSDPILLDHQLRITIVPLKKRDELDCEEAAAPEYRGLDSRKSTSSRLITPRYRRLRDSLCKVISQHWSTCCPSGSESSALSLRPPERRSSSVGSGRSVP